MLFKALLGLRRPHSPRGAEARMAALAVVLMGALLMWKMIVPGSEPAPSSKGTSQESVKRTPTYLGDIRPIMDRFCVSCHGPQRADKGLRLDSYQRTLAGDSYGTVLIPGDSSLSAIVSVMKYGTMPHGPTKLDPSEIELVSRWIDSGAPEY